MKDHEIRELVNQLRDVAIKYHGTDQLREHIARTVRAAILQAEPVTTANKLPELIEGMEVSIDVSTCDADAGNRYFGTVAELSELDGAKNGYILLVQDAKPNFNQSSNSPVIPDAWIPVSERLPKVGDEILYFCQEDGMKDCGIVSSSNFSGKGDKQLYVYTAWGDLHFGVEITQWMPLPASPQEAANGQ